MTESYMCSDCGERVDHTVTVRGVFGEDEVCPMCGVYDDITGEL